MVLLVQQNVEQKDAAIRAKEKLLQEKERERDSRERGGSCVATGPLRLMWRG